MHSLQTYFAISVSPSGNAWDDVRHPPIEGKITQRGQAVRKRWKRGEATRKVPSAMEVRPSGRVVKDEITAVLETVCANRGYTVGERRE